MSVCCRQKAENPVLPGTGLSQPDAVQLQGHAFLARNKISAKDVEVKWPLVRSET